MQATILFVISHVKVESMYTAFIVAIIILLLNEPCVLFLILFDSRPCFNFKPYFMKLS